MSLLTFKNNQMKRALTGLLSMLLFACAAFSMQSARIDINIKNGTLGQAFDEISKQSGLLFFYSNDAIDENINVSIEKNNVTVDMALEALLKDKSISYAFHDHFVVLSPAPETRVNASSVSTQAPEPRSLSGRVTSKDDGQPLPGVSIYVKGTTHGTFSDRQGNFQLGNLQPEHATLILSFIGFITKEIDISQVRQTSTQLGNIQLESSSISLGEVEVFAGTAVDRKTPVAFSSIESRYIDERLGTQEFPELLKTVPSVYATKQGGGYGDARINVRGFDQKNTAVLINGIPVNDPENGWVYWSNWVGLGEVTRNIQVQRGLGASKLAVSSIGGTINVITKTTDMARGGSMGTEVGPQGFLKNSLTLSSGLMDNGWAFTFSGSRTVGEGYVDATYIDAWAYFLSISKQINPDHLLVFTGFGAPQKHGQRTIQSTIETYQNHHRGIRYNSGWGYLDGEKLMVGNNYFHKPQFALNHYWNINDNNMLTTSAYVSTGNGGGSGPFGFVNISPLSNGQIDFNSIRDYNRGRIPDNNGNYNSPNEDGEYRSAYIHVNFTNSQYWAGFISNLNSQLTDRLNLSGGLDVRTFFTEQDSRVRNLFGGDYTVNFFNVNAPNTIARTGDQFFYSNDGLINWYGAFGQLEYSAEQLTVFVSGALSNTAMKRIDRYNYLDSDPMQETDWQNFLGYSAKAGANYNFSENHNIFANTGYFSRAPFFRDVFMGFQNIVATKINNEKVIGLELGYGYRSRMLAMNVNLYNTNWKDKSFQVSVTEPDGRTSWANITGQDALHRGIEVDFILDLSTRLKVSGMASIGDWKWKNDVEAEYANQDRSVITQVNIYADGIHVGDAPQTSFSLSADYRLTNNMDLGLSLFHFDRIFARFDPIGRKNPSDRTDSWQLPSYQLVDLYFGYRFNIGSLDARASLNVYNLLDKEYITDALDGADHSSATARVFYGFGRTATGGLVVYF
jgi:iron complex outermembrane recepter protein